MRRVGRKFAISTLAVAAPLLGLAAGGSWVYVQYFAHPGYTALPFTPQAWAAADAEHRGYMLDDLLSQRLLDGKTAAEVQALLGPPDGGGAFGLSYNVGHRGYNRNNPMAFSYTLSVELDQSGRVDGVSVHD